MRARAQLLATALLLVGFGPFTCADPAVDEAREKLRAGEAKAAVAALQDHGDDAPEVHLARGVAELNVVPDEQAAPAAPAPAEGEGEAAAPPVKEDAAATSLDRAWALVAERQAALPESEVDESLIDLRERIAFSRGLAAARAEDWETARWRFQQVLEIDPEDEDARWNLELAWFKLHPPCPLREDDHEPDDTRKGAPAWDAEKAKQRLLCPTDEDWYAIQAPERSLLFVTLQGKLNTEDGETREVTLNLYPPGDDGEAARSANLENGQASVGISGLPQAGAWTVQVAGPGRAELTYDLAVEVVPPCPADDALEQNDEPSGASAVQDGEQPQLKACPGDPDWYQVTVPSEEARQVVVKHDPARGPLKVTVFDADGETPLAVGTPQKDGVGVTIEKADAEQVRRVLVEPADERENTYTLSVGKPDDENEGDKDQDQKDDQNDQQKDPQDQEGQKPQPPPKPDEVSPEQLIEDLDKHERNPQLEKLLRALPPVAPLEDY